MSPYMMLFEAFNEVYPHIKLNLYCSNQDHHNALLTRLQLVLTYQM